MKKTITVYSIIWAICLALFNVLAFVSPNKIGEVSKFSGSFFVGYIFITVAFALQLVTTLLAFRAKGLDRFFYRLPLISISYGGLIVMLIVGGVVMAIPKLPEWSGIILCTVILAFYAIAVLKATAAAGLVADIDTKVSVKTAFIKTLTNRAEGLTSTAATDELRAGAKKVYEAIRYSDPMSTDALFELDLQIRRQFDAFADATNEEDAALANETAAALLALLQKRANEIKLLK